MRGLLLALLVLAPVPARAARACPALFLDGQPPALVNAKLAAQTVALCFDAFAVLHSGVSRTPLYAAEHLTRASVGAARRVERDDAFHEERGVPEAERAELEDYVHSGFDRGHLAPAGDMPSDTAQDQSFTLANVVPQNRSFNRGLWAEVEENARRLARARGELYVVTGVIFAGGSSASLKGRVLVPTQLFKAIYDPARGEAGAYLAPNEAEGSWRAVSIAALRTTAGIDAFPSLPEAVKTRAMDLPDPQASERRPRREASRAGWEDWFWREVERALRRLVRDVLRAIF